MKIVSLVLSVWLSFLPPSVAEDSFDFLAPLTPANPTIRLHDPAYLLPNPSLLSEMMAYCEARRSRIYVPHLFDCEDIARQYQVNAALWAVERFKDAPAGLACGVASGVVHGPIPGLSDYRGSFGHALVVVCLADGTWMLIEPVTNRAVPLLEPIYEGTFQLNSIHL